MNLKELWKFYEENKGKAKVEFDTFSYRVERGYDIQRALFKNKVNKKDTVVYITHLKIAENNGLSEDIFYNRVFCNGMTYEEAATKKRGKLEIPEEYFKTAKLNNIPRKIFRHRVVTLNWDLDKAANTPVASKKRIVKSKEEIEKEELTQRIKFYLNNDLTVPKKFLKQAIELDLIAA